GDGPLQAGEPASVPDLERGPGSAAGPGLPPRRRADRLARPAHHTEDLTISLVPTLRVGMHGGDAERRARRQAKTLSLRNRTGRRASRRAFPSGAWERGDVRGNEGARVETAVAIALPFLLPSPG